jgi:hypothetical protein
MKYHTDEWVIYDPFAHRKIISKPQKAVILYVYHEKDRSLYDYEIYIDENPGIIKKVKEKHLHPLINK